MIKNDIIREIEKECGENYTITKKEFQNSFPDIPLPNWLFNEKNRVHRYKYRVPSIEENEVYGKHNAYIPKKDPFFEKTPLYHDLKKIVSSNLFLPTLIYGDSGYGKTHNVEQVFTSLNKKLIRFNCHAETDQTDLISSPTLNNGTLHHPKGPAIICLSEGYTLLLDELDRINPNNSLILNSILEGNGYYHAKSNTYYEAKDGFNIIATANSRGDGDDSGRYLSQILDQAFLERFPITINQGFPTESLETKILNHYTDDKEFVSELVTWARIIRKTYIDGGVNDTIATRRLCHIVKVNKLFNNKTKSIKMCIERFDNATKEAFSKAFSSLQVETFDDKIPF